MTPTPEQLVAALEVLVLSGIVHNETYAGGRMRAERQLSNLIALGWGPVGEGNVVVPIEPTEEMIDAGVEYRMKTCITAENNWAADTVKLYRAMTAKE